MLFSRISIAFENRVFKYLLQDDYIKDVEEFPSLVFEYI